ncbi:transcription repressor OFP8-like [Salvia divinorum]|uniref:Transcription repressor n=1 Tax=Salvia divinorum TaxID=28513 RepID=A0ABD1FKX0_SALDI
MDNHHHHLMLKISRLLPSFFTSCHFTNLSDVAHSSVNPTPKPSLPNNKTADKPRAALSSTSNGGGLFTSSDDLDTDTFFSLSSNSGDSFHLRPASTRFKHMDSIHEAALSSSATTAAGKRLIKADELGSDQISTQLYYGSTAGGCRRRRKGGRRRIKKRCGGGAVMGESYAVEKSTRDPRGDFRASMVEMIVEKQMFAAADLERMLRCFLSLNSAAYHSMICDVFSEICKTLFTN